MSTKSTAAQADRSVLDLRSELLQRGEGISSLWGEISGDDSLARCAGSSIRIEAAAEMAAFAHPLWDKQ